MSSGASKAARTEVARAETADTGPVTTGVETTTGAPGMAGHLPAAAGVANAVVMAGPRVARDRTGPRASGHTRISRFDPYTGTYRRARR